MTIINETDREFSAAEVKHAAELHDVVQQTEVQGNQARVSQALALYELHKTDGWRAVKSTTTGEPFPSWTQYLIETTPTLSQAGASKGIRVASLLGDKEDPARLAQAGLEKLYDSLSLVDLEVLKLDQVVDFAIANTAKDIRAMKQAKSTKVKEKSFPLVDFTVTKAMQDRMAGVLGMYREALKVAGNGAEPSDWMITDALLETNATLDRTYIIETIQGTGGAGPRQATTFTDTPPETVINWVMDQYIENGHEPDEIFSLVQGALEGKVQEAKDRIAAQEAAAKAAEADAKKAAKATEASKNKLIRMSANIRVEGSDGGTYMVKEVFKDQNNAFVVVENEPAEPKFTVPQEGGLIDLDALASIVVSSEKVKVKAEKPAAAEPAKFSKQAQAGKGKGSKKAAAKKAQTEDAEE